MKKTSSNFQAVRSLQTMLHVISCSEETIPSVIPDGIYGQETMSAVASFQRSHALPITGITDQETWDTIVHIYENAATEYLPHEPIWMESMEEPLCQGTKGCAVMMLQCMLHNISNEYGCICGPEISGEYDNVTAKAVSELQQVCSLPVTGMVDKITWKHLTLQFLAVAQSSYQRNTNNS